MHGVGPAEGSCTVTRFLLPGPVGAHRLLHLGRNPGKLPRGYQFQQYQFQQQRRGGKAFQAEGTAGAYDQERGHLSIWYNGP